MSSRLECQAEGLPQGIGRRRGGLRLVFELRSLQLGDDLGDLGADVLERREERLCVGRGRLVNHRRPA